MSTTGLCRCGCGEVPPIAKWSDATKGYVKGQPMHYVRGHVGRRSPVEYAEEDRGYETPCWVWQRGVTGDGYGACVRDGRWQLAHRYYYENLVGPIKDGLEIDHLCRVRRCVRPSHLEPVTQTVNTRRGAATVINEDVAAQIREMAGSVTQKKIGEMFGIAQPTVSSVVTGFTWRETDDARRGVSVDLSS